VSSKKVFPDWKEHDRLVERGRNAKETMITANLRLVLHIAKPYVGLSDLSLDDLFQEGVMGLMRAVDKYDHTLGYKFSTYATWWIRQSITRSLADRGTTIRLPVHAYDDVLRLKRAHKLLGQAHPERRTSMAELADELAWAIDKVHFIQQVAAFVPASLDERINGHDDLTLMETLVSGLPSPEEHLDQADLARCIDGALKWPEGARGQSVTPPIRVEGFRSRGDAGRNWADVRSDPRADSADRSQSPRSTPASKSRRHASRLSGLVRSAGSVARAELHRGRARMNAETAREKFVDWLARRMTLAGRGDCDDVLEVEPSGKYWLGRLQSAEAVAESDWGDRGERLEPCAFGIKVKPRGAGPWRFRVVTSFRVWLWDKSAKIWKKTGPVCVGFDDRSAGTDRDTSIWRGGDRERPGQRDWARRTRRADRCRSRHRTVR
jgi:RNA polymerase sigma factor (sigma-70 family)